MDGSGTINPAALNSQVLGGHPSSVAPQQSPRGLKRSRSPDNNYETSQGDPGDDGKPRKRGRPPKNVRILETPRSIPPPPIPQQTPAAPAPQAPQVQTPQTKHAPLPPPQTSPAQSSPAKPTPAKSTVIKALPTVRDHTTDQLNPEGDEYLPREIDEAGESKITPMGHPLGGREYKCRTFFVVNRGEKLFMLATECARVLGYRDSYLLFNKNRSLYKIIATQAEKDDLIHQEILPYSYRSRQIAIVTARSMFRQFGSRVIANGRRVRDDYWEAKARKQGFTEEDAAGEKRPGAAKAREAAALETPAPAPPPPPVAPLMPQEPPPQYARVDGFPPPGELNHNLPPREYMSVNVQRPRHEMAGPAYHDTTQPSAPLDIAQHAADAQQFNGQLAKSRGHRDQYLGNYWRRPHESPAQSPRQPTTEGENAPQVSQAAQSPRLPSTNAPAASGQQALATHTSQSQGQVMSGQSYPQPPHTQNPMVQSPMRPVHTPLRPEQVHVRSPSMGGMGAMGGAGGHGQPAGYGYTPGSMWTGQPQPSPLSQQHNMQQYAQQPPQQSPHPQPSPLHAPSQLHHAQSTGSMHGAPMPQYQTMGAMANPGYPSMGRNPYQPSPSPQQFMQSTAAQQPGMPGWAPGPPPNQQGWQTY
jgi:hypothetical protein